MNNNLESFTKDVHTTASKANAQTASKRRRCDSPVSRDVEKKRENSVQIQSSQASIKNGKDEILDVAAVIGLTPGTRIEVRWDIDYDVDDKDNGAVVDTTKSVKETKWWGGTLLSPDDRTHTIEDDDSGRIRDSITVPIRVIDYDPYLPYYPDRSNEEVCFLTDHSLLNLASASRACWRLEGDSWDAPMNMDDEEEQIMRKSRNPLATAGGLEERNDDDISVTSASQEDGLRSLLDTILKSALKSTGVMTKMKSMEPSQQRFMAERIAQTKERLIEKFLEKIRSNDDTNLDEGVGRVITPELVKDVMEDLGKELRN
mmetsp:Transcript_9289/g.10796  ORF Transcript_9289/g.10796 Transcript_9289/m.10796 type:complete len:316 (+) Transcript_9289:163-1110(+)